MKITVEVLDTDWAQGVRGNCHKCPVALAMLRTFKRLYPESGAATVSLGSRTFQVGWLTGYLPQRVNDAIWLFDKYGKPTPGLKFDIHERHINHFVARISASL